MRQARRQGTYCGSKPNAVKKKKMKNEVNSNKNIPKNQPKKNVYKNHHSRADFNFDTKLRRYRYYKDVRFFVSAHKNTQV